MKAVIQRVSGATLRVDNNVISQIDKGLVIYFCVEKGDDTAWCKPFSAKMSKLRIFSDENGKMNLSVKDVGGQILFVSQFTLGADLTGGNRPSFFGAEEPVLADKIYRDTAELIRAEGVDVKLGVFGADMQIEQHNDGPVTIIWDHTMLKR